MRNNSSICCFSVCVLFAFWLNNVHAACDNPVARIASAQGKVHLQIYGSRNWQDVRKDDALCPGDMLRTSRWSRVTIVRPSGSGFTLDQNSTLTLSRPKNNEVEPSWYLKLLKGIMFIRGRLPERYDIQTPYINAVHKGTEFLVAVGEGGAEITVYDGLVSGENSQGKIDIKPGQKGVALAGGKPSVQSVTVTPEDAVQWALYYPPVLDANSFGQQKQLIGVHPGSALSGAEGSALSRNNGPAVRPGRVEGPAEGLPDSGNQLHKALKAYNQGDIGQALSRLEPIPHNQQTPQHLALKAGLLLTVGRVDEAQPLIAQALRQQPNNPDALALQAIIAVTKNRQQQALGLANKAVSANPGSSAALIALSYAQQSLLKLEDAILSTEKATKLNPDNALAWARLSELQLSQGDHKAALKSAKKAQTLNPRLSRTQTVLGFADLAETDISQAKHQFRQALTLDSTDPLARLGLGLALIRQGDVEGGKNELEAAANLDPANAIIRSYLGKAYYELRDKDYAGAEYGIAKKLDPKDPTPYFYDAILKQTTNRPVEALHDMQKAIELNDNRAVNRSKLLLDQDSAARTANLARIYNDLGFGRVALKQAWNALSYDSKNPTAHRFLSDAYIGQPRFRVARASELLQAQLLQPINITPVQPQLTSENIGILNSTGPGTLSVNEYDPLYNANGAHVVLNGAYGSNNTKTDNAIISGIYNNFSGSLGQFHYQTDGFRDNDAYKEDIYDAFAQYAITPDLSLQAELKTEDVRAGDVPFRLSHGRPNEKNLKKTIEHDTIRIGGHYRVDSSQDVIASGFYTVNKDVETNPRKNQVGLAATTTVGKTIRDAGYQGELQYLFHPGAFDVTAGFGYMNLGRTEETNQFTIAPSNTDNKLRNICTSGVTDPFFCSFNKYSNINYVNGYLYSRQYWSPNLTTTLGFSYDSYSDNTIKREQFNPKLGVVWNPLKNLTLRSAIFRTIKRPLASNATIEPTQVAGFNQFYDSPNGTTAWQGGFGIDFNPIRSVYLGGETVWRDGKQAISENNNILDQSRNESAHLAYFYWAPLDWFAFRSEYRYEKISRDFTIGLGDLTNPRSVETQQVPLSLSFFHDSGMFARFSGTYVNQTVEAVNDKTDKTTGRPLPLLDKENENFWVFDLALGYRLPKKYGIVSIEIRNLFNNNFNYQSTFDASGPQISPFTPERQLFGKLNLFF